MKQKNKVFNLILIIIGLVSFSCKSPIDKLGPDLCPSSNFSFSDNDLILEGLDIGNSIDLSTTGMRVKAIFSETVEWTLKIISDEATKEYSGKSDSINILWYGNSNHLPLFKTGDCRVELEIGCIGKTEKNFKISKISDFSNVNPSFGLLIRDWDQHGVRPVGSVSAPTAAVDGYFYGGGLKTYTHSDSLPSPMGGKFLKMTGKVDAPTWYFGACEIFNGGSALTVLPTSNPDSLYFNMFVRTGGHENTGLQLSLLRSGQYSNNRAADWTDWRMISFPMSEFAVTGSPLPSTDGITSILLNLGSQPVQGSEIELNFDFMMITVGEPFFKSE